MFFYNLFLPFSFPLFSFSCIYLSFIFHVVHFPSSFSLSPIFLFLQFPYLAMWSIIFLYRHFLPLHFCLSFSCPAFSNYRFLSIIFHSFIFFSCFSESPNLYHTLLRTSTLNLSFLLCLIYFL